MDIEGITRTTRGRVVYDRKKHEFRYSDLWRIARSLGRPSGDLEHLYWYSVIVTLLSDVTSYLPEQSRDCADEVRLAVGNLGAELLESGTFPGFSGGKFGGAGSTRRIHWPWQGNPLKP